MKDVWCDPYREEGGKDLYFILVNADTFNKKWWSRN